VDAHNESKGNEGREGIISREKGPAGVSVSDIKYLLSYIWRHSPEVLRVLEETRMHTISPNEAVRRLFIGGSHDSLVICFLLLIAFNDEETLQIVDDLKGRIFDNVDEARDAFYVVCSRHKNLKKKWDANHNNK
jgi:hypothetical protein